MRKALHSYEGMCRDLSEDLQIHWLERDSHKSGPYTYYSKYYYAIGKLKVLMVFY